MVRRSGRPPEDRLFNRSFCQNMKTNVEKISISVVAWFVAALMFMTATVAHAQTASSSPYVTTSTTPDGGVSVQMDLPNNFKGQVYTVYKDGKWQTFSTTTPLTSTDITSMQKEIQDEQNAMQQLFAEQQKLFEQEQQMFQNLWSSTW